MKRSVFCYIKGKEGKRYPCPKTNMLPITQSGIILNSSIFQNSKALLIVKMQIVGSETGRIKSQISQIG